MKKDTKMKKKEIIEEFLTFKIFNPVYSYKLLYKYRVIHFFVNGAIGVLINLGVTAFLAELVFGREDYFYAYLIGLTSNLLYNFISHTMITFRTKNKHTKRLVIFVTYSLIASFIQSVIIKNVVDLIGVNFYLIVIASTILIFSIITFIIFKIWIFKEKN